MNLLSDLETVYHFFGAMPQLYEKIHDVVKKAEAEEQSIRHSLAFDRLTDKQQRKLSLKLGEIIQRSSIYKELESRISDLLGECEFEPCSNFHWARAALKQLQTLDHQKFENLPELLQDTPIPESDEDYDYEAILPDED